MLRLEEVDKFRQQHNNTGVYITAYRYNCEDQDEALLYGDFYLDLDTEGLLGDDAETCFNKVREDALYVIAIFSAIYRIDEEQIKVYFSGKKGLHIVIPAEVFGIEPSKTLNEAYKALASECCHYSKNKTIDLRIYDRRRMFRLPDSKHNDTGLYKIPLTHTELTTLSLSKIKELAKETRTLPYREPSRNITAQRALKDIIERQDKSRPQFNKDRGERTLDFRPPCIDHLLTNPVQQGQRNNTTAVLASYAKQRGLSEEDAVRKIQEWNTKHCDPTLEEREIITTVSSIYHGQRLYGCATLKEISKCQLDKCKFKRGVN